MNESDEVDFFTHRPYEKLWNITHEDLSPMFFEATVRGRLEEDKEEEAVLVLKAPQNVREYFEFKEVPEDERSALTHVRMVHDEYVRIGRKLVASGMDSGITVHLTDLKKFFPDRPDLVAAEPFTLEVLAGEPLWIAAPIPVLVMSSHHVHDRTQVRKGLEYLSTDCHVFHDVGEVLVGELAPLVDHRLADSNHAEIVQPTCDAHLLDFVIR